MAFTHTFGLGNIIKYGLDKIGIKQKSCGCRRRQALLNRWTLGYRPPIYGASGELWDGILDSSRAVDWSTVGVSGGIPTRTTIYQTLGTAGQSPSFSQSVTTAQIQTAIDNCPAGQVVFLNTGTYSGLTGLSLGKTGTPSATYGSGITLRGAGADKTLLKFTGTATADFVTASITVGSGENNCCPGGGGTIQHTASWTAGYSKGTTVVTLANTTGMSVGNLIVLDQLGDVTDGYPALGDIVVSCASPSFTVEGGCVAVRTPRSRATVHTVLAINGTNVTIDPPILMPDFRSGRTPEAWWGNTTAKGAGIEDLSLDHISNGGKAGVGFYNATNSWVKGVRSIMTGVGSENYNIIFVVAARITIRDSYFYGPNQVANTNYGLSPWLTSNLLVENNILDSQQSAVVQNDPDTGSVYAYNHFSNLSTNASASFTPHGTGNAMNLYEGNSGSGMTSDIIHGAGDFITQFRNFYHGDVAARAIQWIQAYNRFFNFVGNVMGGSSYNTYETIAAAQTTTEIYALGDKRNGTFSHDTYVGPGSMRWGNYDTVTAANRWRCGEVPTTLTNFSNGYPTGSSCPTTDDVATTLPASFYLSSRPSWWPTPWGTPPWPPTGPDVTGGNITGYAGHTWKIPTQLCLENTSLDPAYVSLTPQPILFNAGSCYETQDPRKRVFFAHR